jgi:glutamate-1-semialdehyde 2,1-aminomutase
MNFPKSKELFERSKNSLVGGVNSPVRSFRRVGGNPLFAKNAKGALLWDADNREYLDFVMSYGPHLFGHAHSKIVEALKKAVDGSSCLGLSSEAEIEWSELLLKRLPNAQKVRAMSTGTEACATAIRLARGITKRDLLVKFSGHYHGHVDSLLVDAGSGVATLSEEVAPDSAGIPKALTSLARIAEFNNLESVKKIFSLDGNKIACVILEPIMGNMGVVPPQKEFLAGIRELCTQHGALFICDEVMTGLRVHKNSAQGLYGIVPDLTTLGKIVGGGMPLSALAGPSKYMDQLAPLGPVYQAGTLSGNPVAIAAGIAMLKLIDEEDPYSRLENFGRKFEACILENAKSPVAVNRVGSMISLYFRKDKPQNARDCRDIDEAKFNKFFWSMIENGIMLPPSPFEAWFIATEHDKVDFSKIQKALANSLC